MLVFIGKTNEGAARVSSLSERTVYRRLKLSGFKKQAAEARRDILQLVNGQLADVSAAAVQRLDDLVHSKNERVAIQAIRLALDHTRKQRESVGGQVDAPLLITEVVVKEPHYSREQNQADLRALSECD